MQSIRDDLCRTSRGFSRRRNRSEYRAVQSSLRGKPREGKLPFAQLVPNSLVSEVFVLLTYWHDDPTSCPNRSMPPLRMSVNALKNIRKNRM